MGKAAAVVVDCDPGIDDAVALALAVASPEIDLRAVTTLSGNAPVDVTTRNAVDLMHVLGRPGIPVWMGASRALVRVGWHGQPSPHGVNGLGGVELLGPGGAPRPGHAVHHLAALLDASPGSVTVVAIGPLSNIALLLALYPESADRIDRLVVMGGSTETGNITPLAEFNIWTDPEAAHRVLADSGLRVCLVGLDITRRATVDEGFLDALRSASATGRCLARMVTGYGDVGPSGWPLHDALAMAAVIDPTLIETRPADVTVDTGLGPERGRTTCTFGQGPAADGTTTSCEVAVDVDVERFQEFLLGRLTRPV